MSKKILVSTDIIREFFINRDESEKYIEKLVQMRESQEFELFATSKCLNRIGAEFGEERSRQAKHLVNHIIDIHEDITDQAREFHSVGSDSAEELICAFESNFDGILTLNRQNFGVATLEIISLQALTRRYPETGNKFPKHLPKVIFSSLVFLLCLGSCQIYVQKSEIKKLESENSELKKIKLENEQLESKQKNIIEKLGLKELKKDDLNRYLCYNSEYFMPILRVQFNNNNLKESDFEPTGVFSDNKLKNRVIPTFTARCGFIIKFGYNKGASHDIGLDMGKICGNTEEKRMIAIPFKWYEDEPYHHICVNE